MRLTATEDLFGTLVVEAATPVGIPDAIAGLSDAVLEHGRMMADAVEKLASAIEKVTNGE